MHPILIYGRDTMVRLSTALLLYRESMNGSIEMQTYNENTNETQFSTDFKGSQEKIHWARTRRPLLLAPQISPHEVDSRSFENSRDSITCFTNPLFISKGSNTVEPSPRRSDLLPLENLALVTKARARDFASRPSPLSPTKVPDFFTDPVTSDDSFVASQVQGNNHLAADYLRDGTFDLSKPVTSEHAPHMVRPLAKDTSNIAGIDQWAGLKRLAGAESTIACSVPLGGVLDFAMPPSSDEEILLRIWDFEMNKLQPRKKSGFLTRLTGATTFDVRFPWHQINDENDREPKSASRNGTGLDFSGSAGFSDEICHDLDEYFLKLHLN